MRDDGLAWAPPPTEAVADTAEDLSPGLGVQVRLEVLGGGHRPMLTAPGRCTPSCSTQPTT